jgi:hypothetical protein
VAIIGIDLGTSNSAAAVLRGGRPVIIPSAEGISLGGKAFSSYVAVAADGQVRVGEPARRQAAANPEGTATAFKRRMGRRETIRLRDRESSPEQLSAFLRQHVVRRHEGGMTFQRITPCTSCAGRGQLIDQPCPECGGRTAIVREEALDVDIPVGAEEGMALRIAGHGLPSERPRGVPGDLVVVVRTAKDPRFERDGADLWRTGPTLDEGLRGRCVPPVVPAASRPSMAGFRRVRRMVYRRIERRLAELGLGDVAASREYLTAHPEESAVLEALCRIPASRFHRDRAVRMAGGCRAARAECGGPRKRPEGASSLERRLCRGRGALYARDPVAAARGAAVRWDVSSTSLSLAERWSSAPPSRCLRRSRVSSHGRRDSGSIALQEEIGEWPVIGRRTDEPLCAVRVAVVGRRRAVCAS